MLCQLAFLGMLELFLGGGTSLGIPSVPGLQPDIDIDAGRVTVVMP